MNARLRRRSSIPVRTPWSVQAWVADQGVAVVVLAIAPPGADALAPLTEAERRVAELIARGLTNEEISEARRTSRHTVANQTASLFRKIGIGSRAELIARLATAARSAPSPAPSDAVVSASAVNSIAMERGRARGLR